MKRLLITGSSGYIGKHLIKLLLKYNYIIETFDNKYNENQNIKYNLTLTSNFDTVIHLAALVRVNESIKFPSNYYKTNITGTLNVLNNIKYDNFIFASTGCAEHPINPYALSKRCAEDIVCELASDYTIFRFYNVIGSDGITPTNPDGLFASLIKAKETGTLNIFGNDYNTKDGTAVRDYIHVNDICNSIIKAIESPARKIENLGTGIGHTVLEIVETFKKVNNCDFKINYLPRRDGDLECSVLDTVSDYLTQEYKLEDMLRLRKSYKGFTKGEN